VLNAATAARDIINTLTSAPGGWPAHDIHAQWATLLAVLAFPHTARGLRTRRTPPPPPPKASAPPEPATITLALLRAMGHLWDTLMVDDRYLRQLDNHWIIAAATRRPPPTTMTMTTTTTTTMSHDDGVDDGNAD